MQIIKKIRIKYGYISIIECQQAWWAVMFKLHADCSKVNLVCLSVLTGNTIVQNSTVS